VRVYLPTTIGLIYGVSHKDSPNSAPTAAGEVSFQITTNRYTDLWKDAYRKSIAFTIDGNDAYTGSKITANDVRVSREANNVLLQNTTSASSGGGMRRRLLQAPEPATLDIDIRVPRIDDVTPLLQLLATGAGRTDFVQRLGTNLTSYGLLQSDVQGISVRGGSSSSTPTPAPTMAPTIAACDIRIAGSTAYPDYMGVYKWRGPEANTQFRNRATYENKAVAGVAFLYFSQNNEWAISDTLGATGNSILMLATGSNVPFPQDITPDTWDEQSITSACNTATAI
jgi:hypothetical protein